MTAVKVHASSVEMIPVGSLKGYDRNARTHPEEQIEALVAIIADSGFTNPLLIDEAGTIIAGHGRLEAAQRLGMEALPCIRVAGLSDEQIRALRISDNAVGLRSGWDEDLLRAELDALAVNSFDLDMLGFATDDLEALLNPPSVSEADPEATPEPPADPVSRLGDIWLLGKHRLTCGDCMDSTVIVGAAAGEKVDCIFTSPPYGVGIDYGETYTDTIDNVRSMLPRLAKAWRSVVAKGGVAIVNFADIVAGSLAAGTDHICEYPMALEYWPAFRAEGWVLFTRRIWKKPHAKVNAPWTANSARGATDWEHVWVWMQPGKPLVGRSAKSPLGVWDTSSEAGVDVGKETHGAGMPVALVTMALDAHSRPGRLVFEPFCGTGTTIIGAEITGRRCAATEINPSYVDVAVRRWEMFTGQAATLASTGQTFAQVAEERISALQGASPAPQPEPA